MNFESVKTWFLGLALSMKIVLGVVVLLVGYLLLSAVSNTVAGWNDRFESWVWSRRNAPILQKIEDEQAARKKLELEAQALRENQARLEEKYALATQALSKLAEKGMTQDEINRELETALDEARYGGLPDPVLDSELLDRLRKRQIRSTKPHR